jgi:hypothetical protein
MSSSTARKLLFGLILSTSVAALAWPLLNVTGLCFAEGRYLSKAEIISKVVDDVYAYYPPEYYNVGKGENISAPISYNSRDEFASENPECCRIVSRTSKGFEVDMIHKLKGNAVALVEVEYRVEADTPNGASSFQMKPGIKQSFYAVTNCGRVWSGI